MMHIYRLRFVHLCAFMALFLLNVGCSREQESLQTPSPSATSGVLTKTTLLATIGVGENVLVVGYHGAPAGFTGVIFSEQGRGVAYIRERDGLSQVVHNGRPGKGYKYIEGLALSPDGSRTAYVAQIGEKYCIVVDGKEGKVFDNVGIPQFSPDSRHIVYNATQGGRGHIVVDDKVSPSFPSRWDEYFSGDSKKAIFIANSDDTDTMHRVVIYDLMLNRLHNKELNANLFIYNKDRNRIAAIGRDKGKQRLVEFSIDKPEAIKEGQLYNDVRYHVFGPDGVSTAYFAEKEGKIVVVLNGKEEMLPEGVPASRPVVRPDGKAVGMILVSKDGYFPQQAFVSGVRKMKKYKDAGYPLYSLDGSRFAYVARRGKRVFLVVNGKEGQSYDTIVTPMFSPDGKYLVYRARKDGKRFVVIADMNGKMVGKHRSYDEVYQPVFTDDGKSIAYGVKDGLKLIWVVEKLGKQQSGLSVQ